MRVHDSQVYRMMDVRRERISRILELKKKLLSIQTGFNVVNAAVICTVLKIISSLEPLTDTTEAQVLEACDSLKLLTVYFDLLVDAAGVVCHKHGLRGTALHAIGCGGFAETLKYFASSSSSPERVASLKTIRFAAGSQWSFFRRDVTWS